MDNTVILADLILKIFASKSLGLILLILLVIVATFFIIGIIFGIQKWNQYSEFLTSTFVNQIEYEKQKIKEELVLEELVKAVQEIRLNSVEISTKLDMTIDRRRK